MILSYIAITKLLQVKIVGFSQETLNNSLHYSSALQSGGRDPQVGRETVQGGREMF